MLIYVNNMFYSISQVKMLLKQISQVLLAPKTGDQCAPAKPE